MYRCLRAIHSHTHSPTAAELLHTPFFRSAKKKSYLVGTILDGLPPLTTRQERRRRPESTAQRTTDSWDFGASIISSKTPSLIGSSARMAQKAEALGITPERSDDDKPETLSRTSKDGSVEHQRQVAVKPSATNSSFKLEAVSFSRPTTAIPIVRRDGVSGHQRRMASSYPLAVTPPGSSPPPMSSSLWDKLTRRPSRNALTDGEPTKGNSVSRFLRRRGSSLAQQQTSAPSW